MSTRPMIERDEWGYALPTCEGTGFLPCTLAHPYCGGTNPTCVEPECGGCRDCQPDEEP